VFVGHYGVSFAAKRAAPTVPLWVLFIAVQLLDIAWAPLVMLGIERVRIVPGFTATNPLDLYYMPYTHSLVAAILWSAGAWVLYRLLQPAAPKGAGFEDYWRPFTAGTGPAPAYVASLDRERRDALRKRLEAARQARCRWSNWPARTRLGGRGHTQRSMTVRTPT